MESVKCPACNADIKTGFWNTNKPVNKSIVDLLNLVNEGTHESYCDSCANKSIFTAAGVLTEKIKVLQMELSRLVEYIPIITLQNPKDWNYVPIRIVTAQSVTGTGILSELNQTIADFTGGQSSSLNAKIRNGEDMCFAQLRNKTLAIGGNAIIGTDIDYSEVGSAKGMIMVCASGTAVKLINTEVLDEDVISACNKIDEKKQVIDRYSAVLKNYMKGAN